MFFYYIKMISPANLFNNFQEFADDIDFFKSKEKKFTKSYNLKKYNEETRNFQLFLNDVKGKCEKMNYDTDFDQMLKTFNTFYSNYLDDLPNDYLTLQNFTCMLSNLLKNLENNSEIIALFFYIMKGLEE